MSQRAKEKQSRKKRDPGANGSKSLTTPQGQHAALKRLARQDRDALKSGQAAQLGPSFMTNQTGTSSRSGEKLPAAAPPKRFVQAEDGTWEFR